jgi:hypothetical protein
MLMSPTHSPYTWPVDGEPPLEVIHKLCAKLTANLNMRDVSRIMENYDGPKQNLTYEQFYGVLEACCVTMLRKNDGIYERTPITDDMLVDLCNETPDRSEVTVLWNLFVAEKYTTDYFDWQKKNYYSASGYYYSPITAADGLVAWKYWEKFGEDMKANLTFNLDGYLDECPVDFRPLISTSFHYKFTEEHFEQIEAAVLKMEEDYYDELEDIYKPVAGVPFSFTRDGWALRYTKQTINLLEGIYERNDEIERNEKSNGGTGGADVADGTGSADVARASDRRRHENVERQPSPLSNPELVLSAPTSPVQSMELNYESSQHPPSPSSGSNIPVEPTRADDGPTPKQFRTHPIPLDELRVIPSLNLEAGKPRIVRLDPGSISLGSNICPRGFSICSGLLGPQHTRAHLNEQNSVYHKEFMMLVNTGQVAKGIQRSIVRETMQTTYEFYAKTAVGNIMYR